MIKNNLRIIGLTIFVCLISSGCGVNGTSGVKNKESTQEVSIKNDLPKESNTSNSEDKGTIDDTTYKSGIKEECEKYSKFLNENEKVVKFIKDDVDLDGKMEIVIAYGEDDSELHTFILREIGRDLQKLGQIDGHGYGVYDINLVKMRDTDCNYIKAAISNGGGLAGFALYGVNKNEVNQIVYSASATGAGDDGLTSTTNNDIYDGYIQSRYSYEVMYFGVNRYYKWNGKSFEYVSTSVDTGDYPTKPEEVVDQFLKLNMLCEEDMKSSDVLKRFNEIDLSRKQLDLDAIQNDLQESWLTDLQTDSLQYNTQETVTSAVVTIPVQKGKIKFILVKNKNKWQINDIDGNFVIDKR
jgi:hypothetical protein